MKKTAGSIILVCIIGFIFLTDEAMPIYISMSGGWSKTVNALDLQGGPGSDFIDTYESASDAISIDISGTTGDSDNWRVDVKKIDTEWHASLHYYVKRTADGSGTGSISGGGAYQEVTDTYQSFFNGSGDRNGIDAQLRISGVSTQLNIDTYSTTVYYTVVDTN